MEHLLPGLHVLFASALVGGEILLFFAVVPSTWLIDDEGLRRQVTMVVARRFSSIVGVSLVGLLVTGLAMFYTDIFVPPGIREDIMGFHFGRVFVAKMTLFLVLIAMIGIHGAVFGRRIARISDAVEAGEMEPGELEQARRNSFLFSAFMVVVAVLLLFLGASLGNHAYSHDPL